MPQYRYTALNSNGSIIRGESVALSAETLSTELKAKGLHAQRIRVGRDWTWTPWRSKIGPQRLFLLVQELVSLTRAGLSVPDVLALASERPGDPILARVLQRVQADVRSGMSLSQACALYPEVFDALFISSVRSGEKTGELSAALTHYLEFLRRQVALRKKMSQAMAYPVFLLVALAVILSVMFIFVMPRFTAMYANFDARLPAPTQWLLDVTEHFHWLALAGVAMTALVMLGHRSWVGRPQGRLWLDRWKLRLPVLGAVWRTAALAHLARSMATLLSGGTPLVEALRTVQASFPNRAQAASLAVVVDRVTQGESVTHAMRVSGLFPETALKMLHVGEASGGLDRMLMDMARYYEEELETRLARLMALIEPALVLLMGMMIGGIIIVMYLPIFSLVEVIR